MALTEVLVLLQEDPADPAAKPIELTGSLDLGLTQGPDQHLALRFDLALNRLDLGAAPGDPDCRNAGRTNVSIVARSGPGPGPATWPCPRPNPHRPQTPPGGVAWTSTAP